MAGMTIINYTPPDTSQLLYDGTNNAESFLIKFKQLAAQFGWPDTKLGTQVKFHLKGAPADFYQKYITIQAVRQGTTRDKIIIDWDDFAQQLNNAFADNNTYDRCYPKLSKIKYNPLKFETFFYKISKILDDMQIAENERRVNLYLRQLPEDIAKAIAITAPTNENELYLKLKSISQYYENNVLDGEVNTVEVKEKEDSKKT